jgi:hypothetical protein
MEDQEKRYKRAHERVEALKGFYTHLTVYVLVNLGLFAINALTGGTWWFFWPLIIWGIGLTAHAVSVFLAGETGPLGTAWEERKTKEIMEKEEAEKLRTHRTA